MSKNKRREAATAPKSPPTPHPSSFHLPLFWMGLAALAWVLFVLVKFYSVRGAPWGGLGVVLGELTDIHFFHAYMGKVVSSAAVAAVLAWLTYESGNWLLDRILGREGLRAFDRWSLGVALGVGLLSYFTFGLGAARLWYPSVFWGSAALAAILLWRQRHTPFMFDAAGPDSRAPAHAFWKASLITLFFVMILGQIAPETFYDALYYHIAIPNLYRIAHRIYDVPTMLFSNFVLTIQFYFGLALTLGSELSGKLLHGFMALSLAAGFFALSERFFSRAVGLVGAVFFLSTPIVGMNVITTGTDVGWAALHVASAYALVVALTGGERRWLILAALLTGISASCKYPGFPYIPIASLLVFYGYKRDLNRSWPEALRATVLFAFAAGLIVVPILIRNVIFHHNPLYPFLGTKFGTPLITAQNWEIFIGDANTRRLANEFSSPETFLNFILHPWHSTMGGLSNGDFVGPLFLMALPLMFFFRAPNLAFKILRRYTIALWLLWMVSSTTPRYGMPALALVSLLFAEMIVRGFKGSAWRPLILACMGFGCLMNMSWFLWILHSNDGLQVVRGVTKESDLLSDSRSGYPTPPYLGIEWMNQNLPKGSKILVAGEARTYYTQHMVVPSSVPDPQPVVAWSNEASDSRAFLKTLRDQGITHIYLNMAEAVRTENYPLFRWTPQGWSIFQEFWNHHVRYLWGETRMEPGNPRVQFVYEILSDEEAAKPHLPPENPFARWEKK